MAENSATTAAAPSNGEPSPYFLETLRIMCERMNQEADPHMRKLLLREARLTLKLEQLRHEIRQQRLRTHRGDA